MQERDDNHKCRVIICVSNRAYAVLQISAHTTVVSRAESSKLVFRLFAIVGKPASRLFLLQNVRHNKTTTSYLVLILVLCLASRWLISTIELSVEENRKISHPSFLGYETFGICDKRF